MGGFSLTIATAVTTNIIATLLLVLTYTYLYFQHRHSYLAKWVIAWILLASRELLLEQSFMTQSLPKFLTFVYIVMTFAYSLLMISGTVEFAERILSKRWLYAALICMILTGTGVYFNLSFLLFATPAILFVGSSYLATGLVFWQINVHGPGKYLIAIAFILLGLHLFDMPFLFPIPEFTAWGFLIDGLIKFIIAIGIVFVFFEKTKNELEKYYRLLAENTIDVIFRYRYGNSAGFEYISPAIKMLTGYESANFKNARQLFRVIYKYDRLKIKELFRNPASSDGLTVFRVVHKNGDIVWAEQKHSSVQDAEGRTVAVEGIVRDVTKRVLLEQDLARLDRLNIAGQMAANLAHEVRNPLTTIRGYLQLLRNKQEFEHYKGQLGMLLEELDRTNHIITEYLSLSKDKIVDMRKCNLNEIIKSIYPLLQTDAIASNVEIKLELGSIPELYLDDKEIKQMVLNLTRNAIEAMPSGGRMDISTWTTEDETVLSITDQGKGIPHNVLQNLGKPFLTTKESGTGLGMAICYRIAGRHNAKLDIDTGSAGTTVNVTFRN